MQTEISDFDSGAFDCYSAHSDRGRKATGGSGRYIKYSGELKTGAGDVSKGYITFVFWPLSPSSGPMSFSPDTQLSAGSPGWIGLRIAETAFLTCNVLFVMLSGALLLNRRGKNQSRPFIGNRGLSGSSFPWRVYYMFSPLYGTLSFPGCLIRQTELDAGRRFLSGPSGAGTRISG